MCPVPIDHDDYVWLTSQVASFSEDRGVDIPRSFQAWCLEFVHELDRDDDLPPVLVPHPELGCG
jgi:hypothetical protein